MIIARAPFRITLGGGGTDLPSFYEKHGGLVLSMAIDKHIYVTLQQRLFDSRVRLQYTRTEEVPSVEELEHLRAREALKKYKIYKGVEVTSVADLPSKTGLGSSGSYLSALLTALRAYNRLPSTPQMIAEEACDIEINKLKEPVGKQDQYISSFGGVKILDISPDGTVQVTSPKVSTTAMMELISNMHVYYTGVMRNASDVLQEQNKSSTSTTEKLKIIKELGYNFIEAVENQQFDRFGQLLDTHWEMKKQLSNKITFPLVDKLYQHTKDNFGVLGGKIIGAGGGGFLMLYCPAKFHKELENFMASRDLPRLHYSIDFEGARVVHTRHVAKKL